MGQCDFLGSKKARNRVMGDDRDEKPRGINVAAVIDFAAQPILDRFCHVVVAFNAVPPEFGR
jgi:hypothetical protein